MATYLSPQVRPKHLTGFYANDVIMRDRAPMGAERLSVTKIDEEPTSLAIRHHEKVSFLEASHR